MLTRIEMSDVTYRFTIAFRKHNAACDRFPASRTCKTTGRVTEYTMKKGAVKEAVKTTFHNVLKAYVESYNNVRASATGFLYGDDNPPPLYTNSVFLSNDCDVCEKTVRNHLKVLERIGVITKQFRGRKADYAVWITKDFLYGGEGEGKFERPSKRSKSDLSNINGKNLPPINTYREVYEIENGNKDMFISYGENYGENHGERGQTDSDPEPSQEPVEHTEKSQTGGAAPALTRDEIRAQNKQKLAISASKALEGRILKGPPGLNPKFFGYLLDFWFHAHEVLYKEKNYTLEQREKALVAIMDGVYNNFQDHRTDKQWTEFNIFQHAKLDKAGMYYHRHPEQWAPDPYSVAVAGKGYFDVANTKGFTVINQWMKREADKRTANKAARNERELQKQRLCLELLRKCRIDLEKEKAGLRLRLETLGMNRIGIYKYYHGRLLAMGKKFADQLDRQYFEQQARDFAPPKFDRAKRMRKQADMAYAKEKPADVIDVSRWVESEDHEGYYLGDPLID